MAKISKDREQADAAFKQAQKPGWRSNKSDALRAYEDDAKAVRDTSANLKEQRLAREEAARDAPPGRPKR